MVDVCLPDDRHGDDRSKTQNGVSIIFLYLSAKILNHSQEMPDLNDRIYCSEQIHIPPTFPYIMKLYCKAAIRTQPYDLLKWSAAYFRALANGEEPPAKERVEYPPYDSPSGLTPGYIKILINQFGKDPHTTVTAQALFKKWSDICLDEYLLVKLIALLGAKTTVNWVNFVGVCAGFISKSLTQTMILICELFTEEPEGGMATVPFSLFCDLYIFLAQMECGPLTEKEKQALEAIMDEEDICDVADKIKRGEYEGEGEGEYMYEGEYEAEGEFMRETIGSEIEIQEEVEGEGKKDVGEAEAVVVVKEEEEAVGKDDIPALSSTSLIEAKDGLIKSDTSYFDQESIKTQMSEAEVTPEPSAHEEESLVTEVREEEKEGEEEEPAEVPQVEEKKEAPQIIRLEDLEDSIRAKIEEKLGEEVESMVGEDDREFEELGSYLLGAAARVLKFTAETLGFKIFRKYMRQEVPGIGPPVDPGQIEKVVDFLDFWSHKQEVMVMPRNIRHWMCPPLDPIPTPQP